MKLVENAPIVNYDFLMQNYGQKKKVMNKISFIVIMGWCYLGIVVGKMIWKHGLPIVHVNVSSSIKRT